MIAVIFEVWPKADRKKDYLDTAAELRPLLEKPGTRAAAQRLVENYAANN
jgi:hypothetical protein